MTHESICGEGTFIDITRNISDPMGGVYEVVRWCKECGAVVVDEEIDGRMRPGSVRKIQYSQSFLRGLNSGL